MAPYTDGGHCLRYTCARRASDYGEPLCQSLSGTPLDEQVSARVLKAREPAALQVSLPGAEEP
jgi:hypothetical protein